MLTKQEKMALGFTAFECVGLLTLSGLAIDSLRKRIKQAYRCDGIREYLQECENGNIRIAQRKEP